MPKHTLHHVADPNFWNLWKRQGQGAGIARTPRLGEQRLEIVLKSGAQLTVSGGTVTSLELVREKPKAVVRVGMSYAAHPLDLTLLNGLRIMFEGSKDRIQIPIFERHRDDGGRLYVCYDYYWERPHEMSLAVFDEYRRQDGYFASDYSAGSMSIEHFETEISKGKQCPIKFPVSDLWLPSGGRMDKGELALPSEVKSRHVRSATEVLLRFAHFARQPHPEPSRAA